MLTSESKLEQQYGDAYLETYKQALYYVSNPEELKKDISEEHSSRSRNVLHSPYPDPYPYRMIRYQGFVRYPKRLRNFVVSELEPYSERRSFIPHILDIESNAQCNFRCIMCQVSEWEKGKRAENLSFDELKAFIGREPLFTEVKLHGMGEPLLHPRYFDLVRLLVEQDIWVRTSTNGSLFHVKDNARRLIDSGIGEVQVSFDGATKSVYETIRRKARFERVLKNCQIINDYANSQNRLYTRMWVVVQKHNRHQLAQFVELANSMKFRRLSFSLSLNDWGSENWREKTANIQTATELTDEEQQQLLDIGQREGVEVTVWKQARKYSTESHATLCPWVFKRPYVSCDLRVVPCCIVANPQVCDLGSASDLSKMWNSRAYRSFRGKHLNGQIPKICQPCYEN